MSRDRGGTMSSSPMPSDRHHGIASIDAAAELFKLNEERQLQRLASEGVVEEVRRVSLAALSEELGDPHGVARYVLEQRALEGLVTAPLEAVCVTLKRADHPLMLLNSYFEGSESSRPFHDAYIHPPRSSQYRYLPLQLLLAAIALAARTEVVAVELTSRESTLDEIRDLLARDTPTRPLCVPHPASELEPFEIHGGRADGYRMTLHDLSHLIVLSQQPKERPREAVALYDALRTTLVEAPPPDPRKQWCHDLLDHLLSGYAGIEESVTYAEQQLADADRGPHGAWARNVSEGFRRRALESGRAE